MKEKIKVSIVIPVFNVEEYITMCLNSIKNQSYDNYEVVIVNDGSTDRTEELVIAEVTKDARY